MLSKKYFDSAQLCFFICKFDYCLIQFIIQNDIEYRNSQEFGHHKLIIFFAKNT